MTNAQWKNLVTFLDSTGFSAARFHALDKELLQVSAARQDNHFDPHLITETQALAATLVVLTRDKAAKKVKETAGETADA